MLVEEYNTTCSYNNKTELKLRELCKVPAIDRAAIVGMAIQRVIEGMYSKNKETQLARK